MISLIKQLGNTSTIGIHPSYASNKNSKMIGIEKQRLEHILGKSVHHNRFHFLKFSLPKSYQQLLAYGISNDYSMGYADQIGFRAGTCTPFNFYDLENEVQTVKCPNSFGRMFYYIRTRGKKINKWRYFKDYAILDLRVFTHKRNIVLKLWSITSNDTSWLFVRFSPFNFIHFTWSF